MRDLRIRRVIREIDLNTGRRGLKGDKGPQGESGEGVPDGGIVGQVLTKQSNADYDTDWETPPTAPVTSVNGQTGDVVLDADDVGADASGSAAQALADANDYTDQQVAAVDTGVMTIVAGDNITVDDTDPANPVVSAADAPTPPVTSVNGRIGAVTGLAEQSDLTAHVNDTNNPHEVTASQVGLGNVDDTSDADKPVSTATQTALNAKANDNAVVHLAGTETITGAKTFNEPININGALYLSGNGFPNGVVTAPVGSIYIDKAITNGASSWIKKSGAGNTGWVVLEGDTGWRDISGQLLNGWTVSGTHARLRRSGSTVRIAFEALNASAMTNITAYQFPQGFSQTELLFSRQFLTPANTPTNVYRAIVSGSATSLLQLPGSTTSTPALYGDISFMTSQTWPEVLPGQVV